jgi:hypothetical protein
MTPWMNLLASLLSLSWASRRWPGRWGSVRFALTPLLPMMSDVTLAQGSLLAASNYAGYLVGALWCAARPAIPVSLRGQALRALRSSRS